MLPRTGPRSTNSARNTTSLYQAEKSSLCGVTLRSSRAMILRLPRWTSHIPGSGAGDACGQNGEMTAAEVIDAFAQAWNTGDDIERLRLLTAACVPDAVFV